MKQVSVDIAPDGKRIEARSGWYEGAPQDAKAVPGGRWNPDGRCWHYPVSLETCFALRRVYGSRLDIGSKLSRWARGAIAHENNMRALGTASDAELLRVPESFPRMTEALGNRTYQRSGARFIAEGKRVGVFDEVGLGKTIMTHAGIIEAGKFDGLHLVISNTTSLWPVWNDQTVEWTEGKATPFVAEGPLKKRKKVIQDFLDSPAKSKWLVVNPHMLMIKLEQYCKKCKKFEIDMDLLEEDLEHETMAHKTASANYIHKYPELQKIKFEAIIIDEAHKTLSTGNKSGNKNGLTQTALGIKELQLTEDGMKVALTGTPIRGKEIALWGIMNWLWPSTYTSKWAWVDLYFNKSVDFMGHHLIGDMRQDAMEEFWKMIDRHALRRTRREVRADLPQSESYIEWVRMSGKHAKQHEEFREYGEVALDTGHLTGDGILSEMTRLKQMAYGVWDIGKNGRLTPTADSPKAEHLTSRLAELGVTGDPKTEFRATDRHYKYTIATQFTQVANFLKAHFESIGIESLLVTGEVVGKDRGKAIRSFQEDPDGPRIMILNTYAGGESITIDKFCDTMFILDETFVADDQVQLYGRIDNRSVSAEDAVPRRFIHILTKGTIDESIAVSNMNQLEMEHNILDDRRGLSIAKAFIRKEQ